MTDHDAAFLFALGWVLTGALCLGWFAVQIKRKVLRIWRERAVAKELDRMFREFQGPAQEKAWFLAYMQRARQSKVWWS
jgi:hypothetical protein